MSASSSRARANASKSVAGLRLTAKRTLVFVGLCLFVIVASVAGSVFVVRTFFKDEPTPTMDAAILQRLTNDQQALTTRIANTQQDVNNLKADHLSNEQLSALNQTADYTSQYALEQMIQDHMLARDVKTVGDQVRIVPFNTQLTVDYIPTPAALWKRYLDRQLTWGKDSSYWMLTMSRKQQDFSLQLHVSNRTNTQSSTLNCDTTNYTAREHQVAQLMLSFYQDADVCGHIEVGPALSGGIMSEEDPVTKVMKPVGVRPYIYYFTPRTLEPDRYDVYQPLAVVVLAREKDDDYWSPVVFEWSLSGPLRTRGNDYLTKEQFTTAQQDVKTWVKDFAKNAPLYSGFCGYGDCY